MKVDFYFYSLFLLSLYKSLMKVFNFHEHSWNSNFTTWMSEVYYIIISIIQNWKNNLKHSKYLKKLTGFQLINN
jgi:hypothetical protein